jgi:Spy/CpxP family protein refolding chaperone
MKLRPIIVAVALAACIAPAAVHSQPIPWDNNQVYDRLGLTEQQKTSIQDIMYREDKVIRESQAEININRAQLEKLLLGTDPDMAAVERLLRGTLDWKLKSEMAEIRRRVEIRKVLGEPKWEQLLRGWRSRVRAQMPAAEPQREKPAQRRDNPR